MEVRSGACRFGLWYVQVWWSGNMVHRVRFAGTSIDGNVPDAIRKYCAGRQANPVALESVAIHPDTMYGRIYEEVRKIPYGSTVTYGEIARLAGTGARIVGQAMARNPTPLVIPCHRVVGVDGLGGFSPSLDIKIDLLEMEKKRVAMAGKGGV
jgi:methylated-DNA-[protein]-cysteine S-methyltransferase